MGGHVPGGQEFAEVVDGHAAGTVSRLAAEFGDAWRGAVPVATAVDAGKPGAVRGGVAGTERAGAIGPCGEPVGQRDALDPIEEDLEDAPVRVGGGDRVGQSLRDQEDVGAGRRRSASSSWGWPASGPDSLMD